MSNSATSVANKEVASPPASTRKICAAEKVVPLLIADQARVHPDKLALVMGLENFSFSQLELRAARLANFLKAKGAGPETLVGICLERSPDFVVAALAIFKCGAAYLPMDVAYPPDRLRFIARDSAASLLVTRTEFVERFAGMNLTTIALDAEKEAIERQDSTSPASSADGDHLAYVIYTSGSTGQPKGVEITRHNLSNLISWHINAFGIDASTRATFQAGLGFDAAVWEIWPALTVGATLYLPDESTRLVAESLRDWLVEHQITTSFVSTAIAEQLIGLPWPAQTALRFLLTGADTLHRYPPPGLPFALVNNYGPTECTVVATSGVIAAEKNCDGPPSIGFPISHARIHIVDDQLQEVANGATGEIYIGGGGVARGYRNRADLTAERFVPDPFGDEGDRLYRTGDLARKLPAGDIAFLGRIDDQVKIRGFRIELGEINAVLKQHPSVRASVVLAREDKTGEKRLVAYVVPAEATTKDEQSLRDAIKRSLPDYMEPAVFVWMDSLPFTPNGKVDRDRLPSPEISSDSSKEEFVAPRSPVEESLAKIIADVLKLPRVSVHDDFFHLGAHSLLGAQIIARVRGAFGTDLKLLDVFDAPTVAGLAIRVEEALVLKLNAMSEAEVDAALATFDETPSSGTRHP